MKLFKKILKLSLPAVLSAGAIMAPTVTLSVNEYGNYPVDLHGTNAFWGVKHRKFESRINGFVLPGYYGSSWFSYYPGQLDIDLDGYQYIKRDGYWKENWFLFFKYHTFEEYSRSVVAKGQVKVDSRYVIGQGKKNVVKFIDVAVVQAIDTITSRSISHGVTISTSGEVQGKVSKDELGLSASAKIDISRTYLSTKNFELVAKSQNFRAPNTGFTVQTYGISHNIHVGYVPRTAFVTAKAMILDVYENNESKYNNSLVTVTEIDGVNYAVGYVDADTGKTFAYQLV
ncbi:hypothetical protein EI74_0741 [Mycoplasma testudineum]|uniref:Uncharacterized protein n=1 Tax=Mycoplasma testudineum TaxID=244584 RepID=A0A4V3C2S2_9MOLU|nr:hypothetical protein [Mycoplasma testudineum]OYD26632.1 hypothetical protein CG473_03300 [Mycoplasma testudineum]TDO19469.1 hypothetical protein EI74_0741 [Mycoplasma testudineum]